MKVRSYQPHEYFLHLQEQPGNSPSDVPAPGIDPEKTATVQVDRLYYSFFITFPFQSIC